MINAISVKKIILFKMKRDILFLRVIKTVFKTKRFKRRKGKKVFYYIYS